MYVFRILVDVFFGRFVFMVICSLGKFYYELMILTCVENIYGVWKWLVLVGDLVNFVLSRIEKVGN